MAFLIGGYAVRIQLLLYWEGMSESVANKVPTPTSFRFLHLQPCANHAIFVQIQSLPQLKESIGQLIEAVITETL